MEPVQPNEDSANAPAPMVEVPPAPPMPVEAVQAELAAAPAPELHLDKRSYPSLYDSTATTLAAVLLGFAIVAAVQGLVLKLYSSSKGEHVYLTRFVTAMVALIVGAYLADLLIAGPDTSLLSDADHTLILTFLKDTCLMVFSYYFGLKAQAPKEEV